MKRTNPAKPLIHIAASLAVLLAAAPARGWKEGHRWIRQWAVQRLPAWQHEVLGEENLEHLCSRYGAIQDAYANSKSEQLKRYCIVPGVARLSLHDVNPIEPTYLATRWYLERFCESMGAGQRDEAMKYLGVLCHWNEDPGSLSAHSSPVPEAILRELLPPPADRENQNYLFGRGWIGLEKRVGLENSDYKPALLGRTTVQAAVQIAHRQQLLRRHAAGLIVPALLGRIENDQARTDAAIAKTLSYTAHHVADIIFTAAWLARDPAATAPEVALPPADQQLTDWLPPNGAGPKMISPPYYVVPYLLNQAMSADRNLHPLALPDGKGGAMPVAHGLGMGTPCELKYAIASDGFFDRLSVRVGLHPSAGPRGAVQFVIKFDGKEAARTGVLRSGQAPQLLEVPLPRKPAIELSLATISVEDSPAEENLAVWGEPTLRAAEDGSK